MQDIYNAQTMYVLFGITGVLLHIMSYISDAHDIIEALYVHK